MTSKVSLWPADLYIPPAQTPPVTILREQAALLGQQTHNLLEGEVITANAGEARMIHAFEVRAMTLNGYTYTLFYVAHGIELYPVTFHQSFAAAKAQAAPSAIANSEEEFNEELRRLFASDAIRRTLGAMMPQSEKE